jgi:hypothetical protein
VVCCSNIVVRMQAHQLHHFGHLDEHAYSHSHIIFLRVFNVVAFVFLIVMNILNLTRSLRSGVACIETSAWYHTHMTPAPWAFSIWWVIFVLQALFALYQALPMYHSVHSNNFLGRLGFFLGAAFILEGLWLPAFIYEWIWLSFMFMLATFVVLGIAYLRLFTPPLHLLAILTSGEYMTNEKLKLGFYWVIFHCQTSLNFAWISAATLVNFVVFLRWLNTHPGTWLTVLLIIAATVLALVIVIYKKDGVYPLGVAWALFAVGRHHQHIPEIEIAGYFGGSVLLLACVIVVVLMSLRTWRGKKGLDVSESGKLLPTVASR